MRRMIVLAAGLVALVSLGVVAHTPTDDARLAQAATVEPQALPRTPPEPRFTRTIYASTDLGGATALLDKCNGPIAVWLGTGRPLLIAEHDYCGGSSWMSKVKVGDAVKIDGNPVGNALFVVTSLTYQTRKEVTVGDLPDADAVLQTCVTKTKLVLVGLERFDA
jgi:hypothetical protein